MDHRDHDVRRMSSHPMRLVPDEAPDPVETRDPRSRPTPRPAARGCSPFRLRPCSILGAHLDVLGRALARGRPVGPVFGRRNLRHDATTIRRARAVVTASRSIPSAAGPSVIGDMELLSEKKNYVGRAVELRAIPVMSKPGPRTLWVGRPMNRNPGAARPQHRARWRKSLPGSPSR